MKLLMENWRKYLFEDIEFLLENAPVGNISDPEVSENLITYDLQVNNNEYTIKLYRKAMAGRGTFHLM